MATGDSVPGRSGSYEAPVKMSVRANNESGMAIAWLGPNDGSEPGSDGWIEVARICMTLAGEHPDVYEAWKNMVMLMARRVTEHVMSQIVGDAVTVSEAVEYRPRNREG